MYEYTVYTVQCIVQYYYYYYFYHLIQQKNRATIFLYNKRHDAASQGWMRTGVAWPSSQTRRPEWRSRCQFGWRCSIASEEKIHIVCHLSWGEGASWFSPWRRQRAARSHRELRKTSGENERVLATENILHGCFETLSPFCQSSTRAPGLVPKGSWERERESVATGEVPQLLCNGIKR